MALDFSAGALGGVAAAVIVHPLDTAKTRLQLPQFASLYKNSTRIALRSMPMQTLFSGLTPLICGATPASGFYFASYELAKHVLLQTEMFPHVSLVHFVAGAIGDTSASLFIVPAEVLKLRMQCHIESNAKRKSMLTLTREIYVAEGVRGLFRGWGATVMRDAPYSALQFLFYEAIRQATWEGSKGEIAERESQRLDKAGAMNALFCGGVAGGLAAALTNPLDVIKTRMQAEPDAHEVRRGFFCTAKRIWTSEGGSVLWAGVVPRVLWLTAVTSLTFGFYEASRYFGMQAITDNKRQT
jgi:solute carrier family 25 S-adenosylmethionine transporter 26